MKKFLIPVDFSAYSEKAVDTAIALAEDNSELRLLHAYFDPYNDITMDIDAPNVNTMDAENLVAGMEQEASKKMDAFAEKFRKKLDDVGMQNILISHELKRGIPEDMIQLAADEFSPSMIVMGTRGLDDTTRALMGSVTAKVIENMEVPVLAVPENSHIENITKVMYATDFDKADLDALSKLMMIFKDKHVNIHCVHFCIDTYAEDVKVLMDDIQEQLNYGEFSGNIHFELLECQNLENAMEEYIKKHSISMLAMTTHKRNFLTKLFNPSHTKKMLYHTHTPLLAFHA